jgi:hypothetical protein
MPKTLLNACGLKAAFFFYHGFVHLFQHQHDFIFTQLDQLE